MQGLGVLAGFLQQSLGLSGADVGLLVTVAGAAPIMMLLITGHLLDSHDERSIVGVGAVVAAVGLGVAALAAGYPVVLVGLFVLGIGYSTAQPGGSKSVAAWFTQRHRGMAMGIRQAGLPLGGTVAALVLPVVTQGWGWRLAFAVAAAVVLAGGLIFVLTYKRPPCTTARKPTQTLWPRLAAQLRAPAMTAILLSGVLLVTAQYGITTYFMLFLRDHNGIPLARGAILFFAVQAAGALGRIVLAAASDRARAGRLPWIRLCMLTTAAMLALLPLLPANPALAAVAAAGLGFFSYGWYGPWVAHVSESCPGEQVGLSLGTAMAVNQIAIVTTPPILGLVVDLYGYPAMWWGLTALLAPLTFVTWRAGHTGGGNLQRS
jgi:predicted MFS family arabinose efflux permease